MIRGFGAERFDRKVPGERRWADSLLSQKLFVRDRELRVARKSAGELFELRTFTLRPPRKTADPQPNAPLLKRLVLNPYALATTTGKRATFREAVPWKALARERVESGMAVFRSARIPPVQGNPVRTPDRVLTRPVRLSVDSWLANRGAR